VALQWSSVLALRIDAQGHVIQVLLTYFSGGWQYVWYDLLGNPSSAVWEGIPVANLRLDANGHIIAFQQQETGDWYDLAGAYLGTTSSSNGIAHLRLDAQGHIAAVQMASGGWHNLN